MTTPQTLTPIGTWLATAWPDYLHTVAMPAYERAKAYYYRDSMRLEMLPVGFDHSTDHGLVALAINLFGITHGLKLVLADNCSYRKAGLQECQPDLSCYVGDRTQQIPKDTAIVDLDRYPAPDLAVEISKTSLLDDLGIKRSLYEEIGIREYWVVDVEKAQVIAYQMESRGSRRIEISEVLPNLAIALLDEALQRSRDTDQSTVGRWLMKCFQVSVNKCK
jgi:Uma2 family endonuclease